MNINNKLNIISFKGYDARPLKSLHMQSAKSKIQRDIYKELYGIGQKEGFDVFIHTDEKICSTPKEFEKEKNGTYNLWAQDNKMIAPANKGGGILFPYTPAENKEPITLSELTGKEIIPIETVFEGGNIYCGKKDDGENYIIIGKDTLESTAAKEFLKDKEVENLDDSVLVSFLSKGIVKKKDSIFSTEVVKVRDFIAEKDYWIEEAKKTISKDFETKVENIHPISQADFHIDMYIRPLKYPYVLVNDERITDEFMQKNFARTKQNISYKTLKAVKKQYEYQKSYKIAKELEQAGFKPILVGGIYIRGINFLNAIVHEKENGKLTYITNSTECEDKKFKLFQDDFEKQLRENCPDIDRIYFVKGGNGEDGYNGTMEILSKLSGGIHCMTAEEPS